MSDQAPAPAAAPATSPQPRGFGGWLILPMIGVCLSPLRTLADMFETAKGYPAAARLPNGTFLVGFEVALNVGLIALEIIVLVVMLSRRASFPKWFTWLWLAALFLPVVDLLVIVAVLNVPPTQLIDGAAARQFIGAIIAGFWVWYVQVSVRVRNTFTN